MNRGIAAVLLGGWLAFWGGPGFAVAAPPAEATPSQPPDLTNLDADTLRALAMRLYAAVADLQKKLKTTGDELAAAKTQAGKLRAEVAALKKELADQSSRSASVPIASQPAKAKPPAVPEIPLHPTSSQQAILNQNPSFEALNAAPHDFQNKSLTLRGYGELTGHQSNGIFDDPEVIRRFIALTDLHGQRIYVSFPVEANSKLFDLLTQSSAQHKVALKIEATGISTRQDAPFEAAGQSWESIP